MSTRGVYGFRKSGKDKLSYNHSDSYLEGLGKKIVGFIKSSTIKELNQICDAIILVQSDSIPTDKQVKECYQWYNGKVAECTPYYWYCLLNKAQGDLNAFRQGLRYMLDDRDFIKESLSCQYGYIINLDKNVLEVYVGLQRIPNINRYACEPDEYGYYNCKLQHEFPLTNIPDNWIEILNASQKEN